MPSFGAVLEVTRRLREGAEPDDLWGSLEFSADELWQRRYDEPLAVELQKDTENDDLFDLIVNTQRSTSSRTGPATPTASIVRG